MHVRKYFFLTFFRCDVSNKKLEHFYLYSYLYNSFKEDLIESAKLLPAINANINKCQDFVEKMSGNFVFCNPNWGREIVQNLRIQFKNL
jgi:hypothetical protein